jgi:hypothetical protein
MQRLTTQFPHTSCLHRVQDVWEPDKSLSSSFPFAAIDFCLHYIAMYQIAIQNKTLWRLHHIFFRMVKPVSRKQTYLV